MARKSAKPDAGNVNAEIDTGGIDGTIISAGGSDSDAAIPTTDPADLGNDGNDGIAAIEPGKRKPGRPAGSRTKRKNAAASSPSVNPNVVADLLVGIHAMLASATKIDALAIDESEAEKLGNASLHLASFYGVEASEKAMAWAGFFSALGVVYGPRLMALSFERVAKSSGTEMPQPVERKKGNVVNIPGVGQVEIQP